MTKLNLQEVEQNARRVFNEDGLIYIFLGFILVLNGIAFYDSRFGVLAGLSVLLIFPLGTMRERITYPRVGYVAFSMPKHFGRKKLGMMLAMVSSLVLLMYVANGRFPVMPIGFSLLLGLLLYFAASVKNGGIRLREWVIIGLTLVSGVLSTYFIEGWRRATAVHLWFMATVLILMGTFYLIQFIRKHPVQEVYHDGSEMGES